MKKLFIISVILAVFGFTSCEKETSRAIVGKWNAVSVQVGPLSFGLSALGTDTVIQFKSNGTGVITITDLETNDIESGEFEYVVIQNKLTLSIDGEEISDIILLIDGKNMTWSGVPLSEDSDDMFGNATASINFVKI